MKVVGIIDMYSKKKGSVKIGDKWYSPSNAILEDTIVRANSTEFRLGLMAELEVEGTNFSSIVIKNPASMSTPEVAKAMSTEKPEVKSNSFSMTVLTEDNYADNLKKGNLMIKLAKDLRENYMNETGRTELNSGEMEILNSVLKAVLWGK